MILNKSAVPVLFIVALASEALAQQGSQGQGNRRPPPPMMRGFAMDSTATAGTATNIHLFMLELMPPGRGRGPQMLGVNGQSPSYDGISGSTTIDPTTGLPTSASIDPATGLPTSASIDPTTGLPTSTATGTPPSPRGHAMIAGTRYRLANVVFDGGTGTLTPGQPPTSLSASLTTTTSSSTVNDGTGVVGQLAISFQQVEGQTVFTGTAQTDTGTYSLLGSMEPPHGPGGPGGPGGQGGPPGSFGGQGNAQSGQFYGQNPWRGNGQGTNRSTWQGTGQTSWPNAGTTGTQGGWQSGWQGSFPQADKFGFGR